ncbi:hypothetical protein [Vibrio sp. SCSIO 43137]|uniref:hypothetical protein n=1 Tax=Vibrio sp. SCSIO 43137 TaxID=3021011 RepID=UPI0023083403|nr:hypothetical protein [Vibrio sp. SCSIO 43137]WCE31721.1 hypothetical protein PK654_21590 [Vibrio sp. SCSIO 43137]
MKRIIVTIVFLLCTLSLLSFFSVDACMDAGGSSSDWGMTCSGADADFVPQYKRSAPVFWLAVLFISGLASYAVNKLLSNFR